MPKAYPKRTDALQGSGLDPHELAMLFIIFSSGAAADLTLPAFNSEASRYAELCRAALSLRSVFDSPSLITVQVIAALGHFDFISGKRDSMESSWRMMCLGFTLSSSVSASPEICVQYSR